MAQNFLKINNLFLLWFTKSHAGKLRIEGNFITKNLIIYTPDTSGSVSDIPATTTLIPPSNGVDSSVLDLTLWSHSISPQTHAWCLNFLLRLPLKLQMLVRMCTVLALVQTDGRINIPGAIFDRRKMRVRQLLQTFCKLLEFLAKLSLTAHSSDLQI